MWAAIQRSHFRISPPTRSTDFWAFPSLIISEFVIAYSAEGRTPVGFAIARFSRIYPTFLFCVLPLARNARLAKFISESALPIVDVVGKINLPEIMIDTIKRVLAPVRNPARQQARSGLAKPDGRSMTRDFLSSKQAAQERRLLA